MMTTVFIEKITDACKQAGLPKPLIEENSGGVAVEKNTKQLREDGLINRVGGTRGHWEVNESDKG